MWGIVALLTCYVWRISKILRYGMLIFLLLTLASTVYLGLHYALDGYAGIILLCGIWRLTNPLVTWLHGHDISRLEKKISASEGQRCSVLARRAPEKVNF